MGDYSVPEIVRKAKPRGTMVKRIGNGYYVYKYTCTKSVVRDADGNAVRKTLTKMGECIGSITESGVYTPNGGALSRDAVTSVNYGGYAFAAAKSKSVLERLERFFNPRDARQIYTLALLYFVNGFTHASRVKDAYALSSLSLERPHISLGQDALRSLFRNLGSRQERPRKFEQSLVGESSGRIAIDGYVVACSSQRNDLSEYGYKAGKLGTEQVNWLNAFDVDGGRPLLNQFSSGAFPDKVSVQPLFDRYRFSNTLFLVDRGFNTVEDKELMSADGNTYIVPMLSNRLDYKAICRQLRFDRRKFFVYGRGNSTSMVYWREYGMPGGVRQFAFRDMNRAAAERNAYVKNMSDGKRGYDATGLAESEPFFGLFLLETNDGALDAESVFCNYKDRWSVESYYNYVRNDLDFNALYQQDYFCMQGLGFVVTVTGLIHQEVKQSAAHAGVSVRAVMSELSKVKAVLDGRRWHLRNCIRSVRELCAKLDFGLPATLDYKCPT